jgi:hypothetical protein
MESEAVELEGLGEGGKEDVERGKEWRCRERSEGDR